MAYDQDSMRALQAMLDQKHGPGVCEVLWDSDKPRYLVMVNGVIPGPHTWNGVQVYQKIRPQAGNDLAASPNVVAAMENEIIRLMEKCATLARSLKNVRRSAKEYKRSSAFQNFDEVRRQRDANFEEAQQWKRRAKAWEQAVETQRQLVRELTARLRGLATASTIKQFATAQSQAARQVAASAQPAAPSGTQPLQSVPSPRPEDRTQLLD